MTQAPVSLRPATARTLQRRRARPSSCAMKFPLIFAALIAAAPLSSHAQNPAPSAATPPVPSRPAATPAPEPKLDWRDVTKWGVEGRAWGDLDRLRWFDRFPAIADGKVTPAVWALSRDSAGMMARFKTDATTIWAHYVLRTDRLSQANMTAIGTSGLDLYARDEH